MQRATFGRRLTGVSDTLVGYPQSMAAIDDPEALSASRVTCRARSRPARPSQFAR